MKGIGENINKKKKKTLLPNLWKALGGVDKTR